MNSSGYVLVWILKSVLEQRNYNPKKTRRTK